jgi:hypothetical protein
MSQRLAGTQKDSEQRNKDLRAEKETTLSNLQHLKSQMARARERARELLTALATSVR